MIMDHERPSYDYDIPAEDHEMKTALGVIRNLLRTMTMTKIAMTLLTRTVLLWTNTTFLACL